MLFTIKQPDTEEEFKDYLKLRWQLLRAPWNEPEGTEVDDIENQCYHLMTINQQQQVIAVARLQFNSKSQAQIRYMAVSPNVERQGIGRALIHALEQYAKSTSHDTIVLDAREPAVEFYKKLGYKVTEKSYLLFDEIQHYQMIKKLP